MATITLYASKINQMPGLLKTSKQKITDFKDELQKLNKKILKVDNSACDVYNEATIVQASVKTQEGIADSIGRFQEDLDGFISDTVNIDNNVALLVNAKKKDFYEKYSYLKPECEKSRWEKIKDGFKKAWEWCKEHWKEICILAFIVIGAVLTALTGGTFLAALGAGLKAALIAGFISGGINVAVYIGATLISGNNLSFSDAMSSFGDGFESGFMVGGVFAGASMILGSGLRFAVAKSPQLAQKLLSNGKISEFWLKRMVPAGAKNTFVPSDRISDGYKYDIQISKIFGQSTKFQLKWHSPDAMWVAVGSNSGAGWTAQLKLGNKFLTMAGTLVRNNRQNIVHIPIIRWPWW